MATVVTVAFWKGHEPPVKRGPPRPALNAGQDVPLKMVVLVVVDTFTQVVIVVGSQIEM